MNARQLKIFAGITLAVIIAAVAAVNQAGTPGDRFGETELLAPELAARINDVAAIRIASADETFTLTRAEDGWTIPEKAGYPAVFPRIKALIVGTAQAQRVESKTSRPENYPKIGVAGPDSDGDSQGKLVEFLDPEGAAIFAVIVGNRKFAAGGQAAWTYVREPGDAQAWLVSKLPEVDDDPVDYVEKDVINISRGRIRSARVEHDDGESLRITREAPGQFDFTVTDLPEGKELTSAGAANSFGSALGSVTFDDVVSEGDIDLTGAAVAVFETFDGLRVTVRTIQQDQDYWASVTTEYDETLIVEAPEDGVVVVPDAPEDTAAESARINQRVSGWVFKLPAYKARNLVTRLGDIVKPDPPEEDDAD